MAASLFTIFGEIAVNADSANKTIENTAGNASNLAKHFNGVGAAALKLGKTVATGATAAAAAVGVLLKHSISEYSNYEQLVGGVETLFKESSGKVMEYANSAFMTAGMSANKYMETVTSFSSSLLQSLKGDTSAAADVANMAVTDMSDNANKMGTDITMIQNAYQGFAKQNYTMLDNLKLGYGGTKKEMQRLLKDAGKLAGKKYNLKNLSDVIEAIHVIQEQMGIAGTTAKEANETIAGSWATLGSAWENLLAGMSDSEADFEKLFDNITVAAENVAKNIVKVLPAFMKNVGKLVSSVGQYAGEKIKSGWTNVVWPKIQNALKLHFGVDLPDWDSLVTSISEGWNNTVWPGVQNFFKVYFGIDLPEWSLIVTDIQAAWSGTVWPSIQNIFSTKFGVELPDWNVMVTDLSSGWNDTIWPSIQNLFQTKFGVEIPQWSTVKADIETLWNNVKTGIEGYFTAVFSIFTPDESGAGKSTVGIILEWWNGVLLALGNLILSPFGIDFPDAVGQITEWWEGVKKQVSLSLGFTVEPPETGTHESESGTTHGGGAGKGFGAEVQTTVSEDSEDGMQKQIDDFDLEGDAAIYAANNSEALIQAALNSMELEAAVTLKPNKNSGIFALLGIPGFASGIDRVPHDMLAVIHKDETVLKASEAAVYRGEKKARNGRKNIRDSDPVNVTLNFNGSVGNPFDIAAEVKNALEMLRWGV